MVTASLETTKKRPSGRALLEAVVQHPAHAAPE